MDSNINIILIEDFPFMRRIIRNCLLELGFINILEADDGSTGLDIINREKAELIISDYDLPDMTGKELLKVVQNSDELKDIPFLMVMKETQADEIIGLIDPEIQDFIIKPFTADMLGRKIEMLLGESSR
jgi:two-component system, chemotaxis family, chemotaxis protein CheY